MRREDRPKHKTQKDKNISVIHIGLVAGGVMTESKSTMMNEPSDDAGLSRGSQGTRRVRLAQSAERFP